MPDTTPDLESTPEGQEPTGTAPAPASQGEQLTPEQLRAALDAARTENKNWRQKHRELEGKLTAAQKEQETEASRLAAEQGRFKELYESEKEARTKAEAKYAALEFDLRRQQAAQKAGIPALWERLKGTTAEELAEDAEELAKLMAPSQPQQPPAPTDPRGPTKPTPTPQGPRKLTDEERRALATRTF